MATTRTGTDTRLNSAARNIGGALGHLGSRVDALKQQRESVASELRRLIKAAQGMLQDLGHDVARLPGAPGRRAGGAVGRRFSAESRARMAAAQRRRWARYRRQKAAGK
jgi:hypothetical protein